MSLPEDNFLSGVLNDDRVWGFDFLKQYLEVGEYYSFENDHLHAGLGLALISQAVGDSYFYTGDAKNTTRVHPMIIQGSGTGKDPAFDFAQLVARMDDMRISDVNDVTNAGLIGTVAEGEPVPGLAEEADIIGFREATTLFRSAEADHSQNLAENLNQILDGKEIHRRMAGGKLSYLPSCTLVGTSYPPEDLDLERLMNNGTLARFLYFFRPTDSDFRWKMGSRIIAETVKPTDDKKRIQRVEKLGNTLSAIGDEFGDGKEFELTEGVREIDVPARMKQIYTQYDEVTKEIVSPAITRYNLHYLRLSCLMAALDHCSTTVEQKHAAYALQIIEESWENLLSFYQQSTSTQQPNQRENQSLDSILKALLHKDGLTQTELSEATGVSKRTIRDRDTELKFRGLINIKKEGRKKVYYLNQDGVS